MSNRIMCIYHGKCQDGFSAAWVVREALGEVNVDFVPGVYQKDPPDVTGKSVVMVDFSYKYDVLLKMAETANNITIIDHHKTAEADLSRINHRRLAECGYCPINLVFDMTKSGALLTWEHYYPGLEAPLLLQHVSDRDLWEFKLNGTREVTASLFSEEYDFKRWTHLMRHCTEGSAEWQAMHDEGIGIMRKHDKDIKELLQIVQRRMVIGGVDVPVASLPYTMTSDAGHIMSKDECFAACYWDTPEARIFSLRSNPGGQDVSSIASLYGGGGHAQAAGFEVPRSHALAKC